MRGLFGGAALALLILAVAVTPLAATFRPGYFDVRYVDEQGSVLLATLQDQTGLVSGVAYVPEASAQPAGPTTTLVVGWIGGCEEPSLFMRFYAVGDRYRLSEHTSGTWCQLLVGNVRTFAFALRSPIDPATVDIVHD